MLKPECAFLHCYLGRSPDGNRESPHAPRKGRPFMITDGIANVDRPKLEIALSQGAEFHRGVDKRELRLFASQKHYAHPLHDHKQGDPGANQNMTNSGPAAHLCESQ